MLFFVRHLQWLQLRDQQTKEPGFRSHHMPVRSYLMHRDMVRLEETWEQKEEYKPYLEIVNNLDTSLDESREIEEAMLNFGSVFFWMAKESIKKASNSGGQGISTL